MSEVHGAAPAWVTTRDGRVEPFDADRICQSLFTATEALGTPNAFLARELAEAAVHFLGGALSEPAPSTPDIVVQVAKVLRELGQPALAQAYLRAHSDPPARAASPTVAAHSVSFRVDETPGEVVRRCLRAYSESVVFSRDLVSAQAAGLLMLAGLETPQALASAVLDWPPADGAVRWTEPAGEVIGQGVVIDGPEWFPTTAAEGLRRLGAPGQRRVTINLNAAQAPAGARQRTGSPLFSEEAAVTEPALDAWLETLTAQPALAWHWHLQARDFTSDTARRRLFAVARQAVEGRPVAFVFDRPRRPVALAEGLDRQHPAVLLEVGLDLAAFLRYGDIGGNGEAFRQKLPSLARMAVSAGAQKRRYLRRHAEVTQRGFLLDRARLAVVPLGLNAAVRVLAGHAPARDTSALKVACEIVRLLHDALQAAGRAVHLDVGLDSPGPGLRELLLESAPNEVEPTAPVERQLAAAAALHTITGQGTAVVSWPPDRRPSAEQLVEWLHGAWRGGELVRVVFARAEAAGTARPMDLY